MLHGPRSARSWGSLLVGAAFLGTIAGCPEEPGQPPQGGAPRACGVAMPPCVVPPAGFTDPIRVNAMMSIYAHARWPHGVPGAPEIMDLEDAIDVVRCDRTEGAASRRRRAIAKLAAQGQLGKHFGDELARMGVRIGCVREEVVERYPFVSGLLDGAPPALAVHVLRWLFMVIANVLPDMDLSGSGTSVVGTCKWAYEEIPEPPVPNNLSMRAKVSIPTSAIPVTAAARNVDPQRWDNCSIYWSPPDDSTRMVEHVTGKTYQKLAPADTPAPGSDYDNSKDFRVYEVFECTQCPSRFEMVLGVGTTVTSAPKFSMSFWIDKSLPDKGWVTGEYLSAPTKIEEDDGWTEAWEDTGKTLVESYKSIRFDRAAANAATTIVAHLEDVNDALGQLACCEP